MVLRLAAFLPRHRMGVVEAGEPLAGRPVQRQRVIQPARLLWDIGNRVATNRTQWPPSGSTTST